MSRRDYKTKQIKLWCKKNCHSKTHFFPKLDLNRCCHTTCHSENPAFMCSQKDIVWAEGNSFSFASGTNMAYTGISKIQGKREKQDDLNTRFAPQCTAVLKIARPVKPSKWLGLFWACSFSLFSLLLYNEAKLPLCLWGDEFFLESRLVMWWQYCSV